MRGEKSMVRAGQLVLLLLAVLSSSVGAATVMVNDVDVRGMSVGATVNMPVQIFGVTPLTFNAFVLDFSYDQAGLRWEGVSRGAMLAAESVTASIEYAPYLWALESSHDPAAGRFRVTGMILGGSASGNTPSGMAPARVPGPDGVLLTLHFTLLATNATPVSLVTGTVDGRCALINDGANGGVAEEPTTSNLIAGGALIAGTPNWWALENLGDPEADPNADGDRDWRSNATEYLDDTDPTAVDQRLSFQPGWNLLGFCVLPAPSPADWVAEVNAAFAAQSGRADGDLLSATVYYFDPVALCYVVPTAFEAGKAYWFFAYATGDAQFQGVPVPSDYSLSNELGWQMVALPEHLSLAELNTTSKQCLGWDGSTQNYLPAETAVEPIQGYWLRRDPR